MRAPEGRDLLHSVAVALSWLRVALMVLALVVNLMRVTQAAQPWAVLVAFGLIVGVSVLDLAATRWGRRSEWLVIGVDVVVTLALVSASRWALGPELLERSYLGLAVYWMISAPVAVALWCGIWPGLAVAALIGGLAFAQAPALEPRPLLDLAIVLLSPAFAAYIAKDLRDLVAERDRNYATAAALAERDRLSRIVHDGVLQVLALVEREGNELGPRGRMLATLARKQEDKLRTMLQDRHVDVEAGGHLDASRVDLTTMLEGHQSERVTVSTMAGELQLDSSRARELNAVVNEVLSNVDKHAGPDARAWILLEGDDDEVVISIRDNGVGMDPDAVRAAAASGRMGVQRSIVGRIEALGGRAQLRTKPGRGVEWEFTIPVAGN